MNKKVIMDKLIEKLESERTTLAEAARDSIDAAIHDENEVEDPFDTRGAEASFLADAHARRVAEIEEAIAVLRYTDVRDFNDSDPISATALVDLDQDGRGSKCFLLPRAGGMTIEVDGQSVQIVTPQSPLGEALVGRTEGDWTSVDVGRDSTKEYEIRTVQ